MEVSYPLRHDQQLIRFTLKQLLLGRGRFAGVNKPGKTLAMSERENVRVVARATGA